MGPPLRHGETIRADAVGKPELDDGDFRRIKIFIDRHASEHASISLVGLRGAAKVYCILPHAERLREEDGRYVRKRFSCAGFVFEAYKAAGITLVDADGLPPVTLEQIKLAYPSYESLLDHARFRGSMGLSGQGPWAVMLCGYLINALGCV
jgi:hypothetical protein